MTQPGRTRRHAHRDGRSSQSKGLIHDGVLGLAEEGMRADDDKENTKKTRVEQRCLSVRRHVKQGNTSAVKRFVGPSVPPENLLVLRTAVVSVKGCRGMSRQSCCLFCQGVNTVSPDTSWVSRGGRSRRQNELAANVRTDLVVINILVCSLHFRTEWSSRSMKSDIKCTLGVHNE